MTEVVANIEVAKQIARICCEAMDEYGESPTGFSPDYSGRFMYGRGCLGFVLDDKDFTPFAFSAVDYISEAVEYYASYNEDSIEHLVYEKAQEIIEVLKAGGSIDNMGLSYIHYFKGINFTEEEVVAMKGVVNTFR